LSMAAVPADFIDKWRAFWEARASVNPASVAIATGCLATILLLRRVAPRFPSFLVSVAGASAAVAIFSMPVDTIGSRFGALAAGLPLPSLPDFSFARARELMPSALTIAFLAGVESLLSAVVADGMTGRRHRSNTELTAQGIANIASALF